MLQDLHRAMVVLGLCPMEQEVIDMTNEVAKESYPEPVFTNNISGVYLKVSLGQNVFKDMTNEVAMESSPEPIFTNCSRGFRIKFQLCLICVTMHGQGVRQGKFIFTNNSGGSPIKRQSCLKCFSRHDQRGLQGSSPEPLFTDLAVNLYLKLSAARHYQ